MSNGALSGRSLSRALSVFVVMGLALFATVAASVGQQRQNGFSEAIVKIDGNPYPVRAFCFDPRNPPSPEIMEWIHSLGDPGVDFQLANSFWGQGSGSPVALTWSLVPDGTLVPGLSGQSPAPSNLFARMNQIYNNNQALWIGMIEEAFDRWAALSGVQFTRITFQGTEWDDGAIFPGVSQSSPGGAGGSTTRGHFRIGMRAFSSNGVLAFNYYPTVSDMVINANVNWGNASQFRNVLMHEIGHGLGFAHCCPQNSTKLMEPALSTQYYGPQHDDVRGAHVRYGDAYEPNNTIGQATDLGSLSPNQSLLPSTVPGASFNFSSRTSIDRAADQDWFRFHISEPLSLSVTVTPIGHSYANGPQLQSGACSSGTTENSLTAAALAVQVWGPNTSLLIATAASNPAGMAESLTNIPISQPGNYFARVYATSATGPQLYRIQIVATPGGGTCPVFTLHPEHTAACEDGPFELSVQVTGTPTPALQWRRNGVPLGGATGTTYSLPSATTFNAGEYDVVATNSCGSVISQKALLTINTPPILFTDPLSQNVNVGAEVTLKAEAIGTPQPDFRWFKDNEPIPGGADGILVIESVTLGDAGIYRAEAYNSCGEWLSNPATLTVEGGCYANCDNSTTQPVLNVEDFTCFINRFAAAQSLPHEEQITDYANCDGSTTAPVLNVEDFTCFINAFAQGCP